MTINLKMNSLPTALEEIIHKYSHNLKMNDVLNEFDTNQYWCAICGSCTHESITPVYKQCNSCEDKICVKCINEILYDNPENIECNDCFFTGMFFCNIEKTTGHDLTDEEFDLGLEILTRLHVSCKEILCDFLYDLSEVIIEDTLPFDEVYNNILDFIEDTRLDFLD
jgi:hypothetical protein